MENGNGEASPRTMCGGWAAILGIGTAVPPNVLHQSSFPAYYFDITNSNHMVDLKAKFAAICDKTMIEKRHFYMSDDFLRSNPSVATHKSPSFDPQQSLSDVAVPQLGAEAARVKLKDIDLELVKLLGLPVSTKRFMLYQAGCHGGGTALRLAKDIAENNPGARVLVVVVCSEVGMLAFRGPSESQVGNLVGQAIFGDAAGAVVVGTRPAGGERALFELVSASQDTVPGTEEMVAAKLREVGIVYSLHRDIPFHISSNIEAVARKALEHVAADWNEEVFWLVHPGGRAILEGVADSLGLRKGKLDVSCEVMRQHGNTLSSSVVLAMDEMRRSSEKHGLPTAGEGLRWGLLFGFGPGLTVETILLRAPPTIAPIP